MMKKGIPGKHLRAFAVQEACMKVLGKGLGLALILLLIPLSATAFVPDGTHLVDLMVRAMGPAKKVRLDVQLEIQGADPAKPHLVQESLLFKVPEAFRSETRDGRRVRLGTEKGDFLLVLDGKIIRETPGLEDLFYVVLLIRNQDALISFFENLGMDMEKTGLTRYGGRICYRLGAEEGTRLLIDKESLRPLALTLAQLGEGGGMREVTFRYWDWQVSSGAAWPLRIEILGGEKRLLQAMLVQEVKPEVFSDGLFSAANLRMQYSSSKPPSPKAESDPLLEIEEGLERLRRRYD
jgi:hypothetical protein